MTLLYGATTLIGTPSNSRCTIEISLGRLAPAPSPLRPKPIPHVDKRTSNLVLGPYQPDVTKYQ